MLGQVTARKISGYSEFQMYLNVNGFVQVHSLIELDLQGRAVRFQRREKLPVRRLAVDFDVSDCDMVRVQNNLFRITVGS